MMVFRRLKAKSTLIARWVLGGLFVWSGVVKIIAPAAFFGALLGYDLPVTEKILRLVAVSFPWLEALCGAALVMNVWPSTVRPLVAGLCALFCGLIGQALVRGLSISCGCFGGASDSWINQPAVAFVRALLLLGLAWHLLRASRTPAV